MRARAIGITSAITFVLGCGSGTPPAPHEAAAHVENPVPEGELAIVRLSADAMRRLAIETATVEERTVPAVRLVGGEVVIPPGRAISVAAPVGGMVRAMSEAGLPTPGTAVHHGDALFRLVPFAPVDRDVRARAGREVAAARAQLSATEARLSRVEQLVAERAGSQRMLEEATVARDVARADVQAAEARAQTTHDTPLLADVAMTVRAPNDGIIRAITAAPGQAVAAAAPLLELVAVDALQIRVPVYAGDLARLEDGATAHVRALGGDASIEARPVIGPPTGDPIGATVDRWYALASGAGLAPGERVMVELPLRAEANERVLPWASIVVDAQGSAWIYACAGENAFRRERIDPIRRAGEVAVFARGPEIGACVASVGAAEIFGSEFEPGH